MKYPEITPKFDIPNERRFTWVSVASNSIHFICYSASVLPRPFLKAAIASCLE